LVESFAVVSVSVFVTSTVAPAIAAPDRSLTAPRVALRISCEDAAMLANGGAVMIETRAFEQKTA